MTSILVLSLLLAFVFGGMMLALVMGYMNTEQERAKQNARAAAAAAERVASLPQFFRDPNARQPTTTEDDHLANDLVGQFEHYLQAEQAAVARFVNEPSIDNLYRRTPASPLIQ